MEVRQSAGTRYIPALDGWRALAVTAVILYHGVPLTSKWSGLTGYGYLGVDFFFGISGFLICSRLLEEEQLHGRISLKKFYIRRAFRILPPAFLFLIIAGCLGVLGLIALTRSELFSSAFFFRNYLPVKNAGWYTGHFWSLAVEEHFYLLWPGLLVLFGTVRARWIAPLLGIGVAGWRGLDHHFNIFLRLFPSLPGVDRTDLCLDGLIWGCVLALFLREKANRDFLSKWLTIPVWLIVTAMFVLMFWLQLPSTAAAKTILIPLVLAAVLHSTSIVGKFLELSPLRWIGRISYSLYLWQQLFSLAGLASPHGNRNYPGMFSFCWVAQSPAIIWLKDRSFA